MATLEITRFVNVIDPFDANKTPSYCIPSIAERNRRLKKEKIVKKTQSKIKLGAV